MMGLNVIARSGSNEAIQNFPVWRGFWIASLALAMTMSLVQAAHAACTNPAGDEGAIVYNGDQNVPQICTGSSWVALGTLNPSAGGGGCTNPTGTEGQIVYNGDVHKPQYCDGDDWIEMIGSGGGGLTGPAGCMNIGDLCADGTVFAGWNPVTQDQLFIPPTDQGTTSAWKTSTGTDDIATDSTYDGRANTNQVANSTTFPAFKLCKDWTTGGHSDWYLPSQVEIYYLWALRGTIEAGGNITNFQNAAYWSSTEYSTTDAWYQLFPNAYQNDFYKTTAKRVRCVRR